MSDPYPPAPPSGPPPGEVPTTQAMPVPPAPAPPPAYGPPPGAPAYTPPAPAGYPQAPQAGPGQQPGYGPAPGYQPQAYPAPPRPPIPPSTWLGTLAAIGIIAGLSIPSNEYHYWKIEAWAGFAAVCALALLLPWVKTNFRLNDDMVFRIAVAATAGLAWFWFLFVIPRIDSTPAFIYSMGLLAAVLTCFLLAPKRATTTTSP